MSTRATLTTKGSRAKCLNYRNGKRCGRLGRYLVSGSTLHVPYRYPACADCKDDLIARGGRLKGYSPKGYTVCVSTLGPVAREYTPIEPTCASCGATPQSPADAYCHPCGVEVTDCEGVEQEFLAFERACEVTL